MRAPSAEGEVGTGVAWAIGSKVGTAVVRNRLRRRLRVLVAQLDADPGLVPGLVLVGARPEAVALSGTALAHHLRTALERCGALSPAPVPS